MKNALLLSVLITLSQVTLSQDFSGLCRQKMSWFNKMQGRWEGTSWKYQRDGSRSEGTAFENLQFDLNRTILKLNGLGTVEKSGSVDTVHQAFGVLYYDPFIQAYKVNTWVAQGMSTLADVTIISDSKLSWSFQAGPRKMRYTVEIANGKWTEIGEMSMDGENWNAFMGMELLRKESDQ